MKKSTVYVVYVNSDLTEGKGKTIPLYVCKLLSTATRKSRGEDVQGSDGVVKPVDLIEIIDEKGIAKWYAPVSECIKIIQPNKKDISKDKEEKIKQKIIQKAKDLGLSEKEIKILKGEE
jgi:hypothetical protein